MPVWIKGDLHRENPPSCRVFHQLPLTQIWKSEFLGKFSLYWLSRAFSVFLEEDFPQGWELNPYNCGYPTLMVLETRVSWKPPPHLRLHCSAPPV